MTREELVPCPFCGGKAEAGHGPSNGFYAGCDPCGKTFYATTYKKAIAAWNRRAFVATQDTERLREETFQARCVLRMFAIATKPFIGNELINQAREAGDKAMAALAATEAPKP